MQFIKLAWFSAITRILVTLTLLTCAIGADQFIKIDDKTSLSLAAAARAYLLDDQRIQWSGMEFTFGAESDLTAKLRRQTAWGEVEVQAQFFLNQPFDANRLLDEPRARYFQNFDVPVLEVKQLLVQATAGSWTFGLGKHLSRFGRDDLLHLSNALLDSPFIRSEAIFSHETGFFLRYARGRFSLDLSLTNGGEDRDTNGMKAGIIRLGYDSANGKWGIGLSGKYHNGIGSEWQKRFNNHVGVDFCWHTGHFQLAGELLYDEYGFRRDYPIDEVFWPRSYYYRDLMKEPATPFRGFGGYIDLRYDRPGSKWMLDLTYSDYYPEKIGHPYHDDPIRRTIVKVLYRFEGGLQAFAWGVFENNRTREPLFAGASPFAWNLGVQYSL